MNQNPDPMISHAPQSPPWPPVVVVEEDDRWDHALAAQFDPIQFDDKGERVRDEDPEEDWL